MSGGCISTGALPTRSSPARRHQDHGTLDPAVRAGDTAQRLFGRATTLLMTAGPNEPPPPLRWLTPRLTLSNTRPNSQASTSRLALHKARLARFIRQRHGLDLHASRYVPRWVNVAAEPTLAERRITWQILMLPQRARRSPSAARTAVTRRGNAPVGDLHGRSAERGPAQRYGPRITSSTTGSS